ncbi:30S ribosomal protein S16 [Methylothermus subterraneus]
MVKIRLARTGKNKRPFYHVVVADSRAKRDGRHIERVGYFNPLAEDGEARLKLDMERVELWLGRGAQMTDRVKSLLREWRKRSEGQAA